ncbi:MAG: CtsR family transcriptional regulator [Synergistaceae bacterium]|jgi:transcriptional regulator CtsR|nr:CtsR family transcriptional regulator [Synergistaceae bacterium]
MNSLTKVIGDYIVTLFDDTENSEIVLSRKDLAQKFGCVPSQINYVLRSRFSPEQGFLIQSQRGGHGFIRIMQLRFSDCDEYAEHLEELVGSAISDQEARRLLARLQERAIITPRERLLVEVALRNQDENGRALFDLPPYKRDTLRAELLRKILVSLAMY